MQYSTGSELTVLAPSYECFSNVQTKHNRNDNVFFVRYCTFWPRYINAAGIVVPCFSYHVGDHMTWVACPLPHALI